MNDDRTGDNDINVQHHVHHPRYNCPCGNDHDVAGDDYVLVRRADLDNLRAAVNNVTNDEPTRDDVITAAEHLVDSAVVLGADTADLWAKRAAFIDATALHQGYREWHDAKRALVAALRETGTP